MSISAIECHLYQSFGRDYTLKRSSHPAINMFPETVHLAHASQMADREKGGDYYIWRKRDFCHDITLNVLSVYQKKEEVA